jgi:ABC-2 type transport system permease protein
MRVFTLALKDLQQTTRDVRTAVFVVLMPLLFTYFLIAVNGGATGSSGDNRLALAFLNHDEGGVVSAQFSSLLDNSEVVRLVVPDENDQARLSEQVRDGNYTAALILPAGYSAQLIAGKAIKPQVIVDQGSESGQSVLNAIETASDRLQGVLQIARQTTQTFETKQPFPDATARQNFFNEALVAASGAWKIPTLTVKTEQGGTPATGNQISPATQLSPGILVQFVVLGLVSICVVFFLERKTQTLSRMLTTPISPLGILLGHGLAMAGLIFFQEILLIAFGQIAFGVDYLRDPVAVLLVMLALAVWAASLGLLIAVFARVMEQVVMFSLIAMFTLSTLGGCWFPLEITGPVFSAIGHLTPSAWAMEGFQNVIVRGQGIGEVWLPVGILLAYTAVFFSIVTWKFQRRTSLNLA